MYRMLTMLILALGIVAYAQNPAMKNLAVARYFPKDTPFIIAVANPEGLMDKTGWKNLPEDFEAYAEARNEVKNETGYDLLCPAGLREIGLDPQKPAGFGYTGYVPTRRPEPAMFVFFASLSSAEKFQNAIFKIAETEGSELESETVGDAVLIYPTMEEPDVVFVIRGGYLFVVGLPYPFRENGLERAKDFAQVRESDSLSVNREYVEAMQTLGFGKDLSGYFSISALINEFLAYKQEQLARPVEDEWEQLYRERDKACYELAQNYFGSFTLIAFGAELEQNVLNMKFHVGIKAGAALSSGFKKYKGLPLLYSLLSDPPQTMIAAALDPKTFYDFIMLFIAADEGPEDVEEIKSDFKKYFDLDIAEFPSLLTGEAGFAYIGNLNYTGNPKDLEGQLGCVAFARLKKPERVKAFVERIASHPDIQREGVYKEGNVFVYPIPDWKNIYFGVAGDCLLISTDKGVKQLMSRDPKTTFVKKYQNPRAAEILCMPQPAIVAALDARLLGYLAVMENRSYISEGSYRDLYGDIAGSEKILEEIENLQKELKKLEEERNLNQKKCLFGIFERFGTLVASAKTGPQGLMIQASLLVKTQDLATLIASTIEDTMIMESSDYPMRLSKIYNRIWELCNELERMRREEH